MATLSWAYGVIDENHVKASIMATHQRIIEGAGPPVHPEYWQSITEAAVEAAVWSIADRAKGWTSDTVCNDP
ncbi:MAG: hypothetical protein ACRDRK_27815 [Pseudonocardia sp.]